MIMNNAYDIIMNALGYDIMTDIIYSYYQTGAYIIIIFRPGKVDSLFPISARL